MEHILLVTTTNPVIAIWTPADQVENKIKENWRVATEEEIERWYLLNNDIY